jgi:Reverse transcriptase (RNA-dependent DNA polymerase)/Endonuclease-reverse transcriptase
LSPDVILISESWCNNHVSNALLSVPGYDVLPDLRRDREDTTSGIGGGLLVYAKNGTKILPLDTRSNFSQHVGFTLMTGNDKIDIVLVYRPPKNSVESFRNLAELIRSVGPNTILIGDFNLPGINWIDGVAHGEDLLNVMEACHEKFIEQVIDFPTHLKGNCLDLLLTNIPERILDVANEGRLGTSDHYMISASLAVNQQRETRQQLTKNWWKADWAAMKEELAAEDWASVDNMTASEGWQHLSEKISSLIDRHVPTKPRGSQGRPPWMTRSILREVRKKRRMWAKEKGSNISPEYREVEKKVRNLIRNAKRNMERQLANENNGNSKPFYAYLKSKTRNRTGVGPLVNERGQAVSDKKEMANILNRYFGSVFSVEPDEAPAAEREPRDSELHTVTVDRAKVLEKIKALKPASAPGPDGIGAVVLRELAEYVADPLVKVYEKSLATGEVPEDWKTANVTPIYKKGKKSDPANYRPVSLTSISCKILESIIRDDMVDHLVRNGLIEDSQHGFVAGRSCCTNLVEFFDKISELLDQGGKADAIFLDFAKAFDKVPHKRLLEKLKAVGIGGHVLTWIADWLANRKQRVVLDGEASGWEQVCSGVPQGSVLGPVLFLVFIRDLDRAADGQAMIRKFADDTKMAREIKNDEDSALLQRALDGLQEWARKWGMEFNSQKCKVMHFGTRNPRNQYRMGDHVLETTEEEKDVGVLMNSTLKPAGQCAKAAQTATTVLYQIGKAFKYRDKKVFPQLYKRYVRPHLEFSSPAWSPWHQKDIEVLERVQKRAVNMVQGLAGLTYEQKLTELGLESLYDRRVFADLVLIYKVISNKCTVNKNNWPSLMTRTEQHTRATTDPLKLQVPFARTELRKNFYTVRVCDSWNKLPLDVRAAKSVRLFKFNYRKLMSTRQRPGDQPQHQNGVA